MDKRPSPHKAAFGGMSLSLIFSRKSGIYKKWKEKSDTRWYHSSCKTS
jgi:hypothetical protein